MLMKWVIGEWSDYGADRMAVVTQMNNIFKLAVDGLKNPRAS